MRTILASITKPLLITTITSAVIKGSRCRPQIRQLKTLNQQLSPRSSASNYRRAPPRDINPLSSMIDALDCTNPAASAKAELLKHKLGQSHLAHDQIASSWLTANLDVLTVHPKKSKFNSNISTDVQNYRVKSLIKARKR